MVNVGEDGIGWHWFVGFLEDNEDIKTYLAGLSSF